MHNPTGWNTWDFRGFNRLAYLHRGRTRVILQYAIWDEDYRPPGEVKNRGGLRQQFRWNDVTRLGPHAPLGLPAALEFTAGGVPFRAEAEEAGDTLRLTVTPLAPTRMRVVFLLLAPVGEPARVTSLSSGIFAGCQLEFEGAAWPHDYFLNVAEPYAVGQLGHVATVRVTVRSVRTSAGPSADAPGTFDVHQRGTLTGAGALADAPEAMVRAVTWNTLYDTRRKLISSPVSRDWCADWKGVAVWCWDTFMLGAFISYESPVLARLNFEAVTAAIDELGMVPNYYMAHGAVSKDRSMPCLGSYTIWKVQRANPDRAWLRRIYPRLLRWHRYWTAQRDGNGDGLLEWGSGATPVYDFPQLLQDNPSLQHSAQCAKYESGLDNSPMYDDVPFNPQAHTLELADVGLNSYYAMDCEALVAIAELLGRRRDAAKFREEYEALKERVNRLLWDEEHGIYCNRHWDGRLSGRWSPTSFFPLLAGLASRERAERLIRAHLLNPREFCGEYVIPSIARSDPAYADNDYWRGRIWGPFNFLVAEGLRRYRFDDAAAELAKKGLNMFLRNWREDGGVYENYNAETGRGGDVWNAARLYHWGGLLAFIAIQELIDVEPAGYLRLGSLKFPDAGVRNVRVGGDVYDVELERGVRVLRNGQPYLECDGRVVVRIPLVDGPERPIEVAAAGPARIIFPAALRPWRSVLINGNTLVPALGPIPTYVW